jgi:porin
MKNKCLLCFFAILFSYTVKSQDTACWQTNFSLIGDYVVNTHGGIKKGDVFLGLASLGANYQSGNNGFWKNGELNITIHKTTGGSASGSLIGDAQVVSNIEGASPKLFYELWVKQSFGQFSVTAGLHDMNSEFFVSEHGGFFVNSSFGIGPSFSLNMPVSIYPVTTLAGVLTWSHGAFSLSEGFYNLNHEFVTEETFHWGNNNFSKGFLSVTEGRIRWENANRLLGEYKLGVFYKNCNHDKSEYIDLGCNAPENYGMYLIADQYIYSSNNKELGLFVQAGINPYKLNTSSSYYGGGITAKGFLTKSAEDVIGIGVAHAAIGIMDTDNNYLAPKDYETTIELSLEYPIFKRISIQPDIQYVINPGGVAQLSNALVAIFRTKINLN